MTRDLATPRHDWTLEEVEALFARPFMELVYEAATVHRRWFDPSEVQKSRLLSIKTGGCAENCGYCSQSASFDTGLKAEKLMDASAVIAEAMAAKAGGAGRFCMGAAWRELKDRDTPKLAAMIAGVKALGLETCATLGMLTADQARQLKEAGLDYYNHNLDTGPDYYAEVVTTRTYQDRLDTLKHVWEAGMSTCCGGIVGMGETRRDRAGLLQQLATLPAHPERARDVDVDLGADRGDAGAHLLHELGVRPAHGGDDAELRRAGLRRLLGGLDEAVLVQPRGAHGRLEEPGLRAEVAVLGAAAGLQGDDALDLDLRPAVAHAHLVGERQRLGQAVARELQDGQDLLLRQALPALEHLLAGHGEDVPAGVRGGVLGGGAGIDGRHARLPSSGSLRRASRRASRRAVSGHARAAVCLTVCDPGTTDRRGGDRAHTPRRRGHAAASRSRARRAARRAAGPR